MKKPEAIHAKLMTPETIVHQIAVWRFLGYTIVFTNGCFDILHAGHMQLLNEATILADRTILIIGLNGDASVKRLKGSTRPINSFADRAHMLANLYVTDAIIEFVEDTPYELIKLIQPDILVKGGDYKETDVVGNDLVKATGGRVEIIPFLAGYSTTKLLTDNSMKK